MADDSGTRRREAGQPAPSSMDSDRHLHKDVESLDERGKALAQGKIYDPPEGKDRHITLKDRLRQ